MALMFFAGVVDTLAGLFLVEVFYTVLKLDPLMDWKLTVALAIAILGPWGAARRALGASFGEKIWKTREGKTSVRESSDNLRAILLTIGLAAITVGIFERKIAPHPYWVRGQEVDFPAVMPPSDWRVLSFYYTMAPWPTRVGGNPVFYSIPYEMGPPKRFLGHIESDWIRSSVRVSFEGPKTPMEFQSRVRGRQAIHDCVLRSPLFAPQCAEIRRLTLDRHLDELRALGYTKVELAWFSSENQAIPSDQRAQGVRLRGHQVSGIDERIQDRYILITPQGLHQMISVSYFDNAEGRDAEHDFELAIGALRISEDINQGRAWTDSTLESTKLGELPPITDEDFLTAISEVQGLLVSKISVDPGMLEPYYHLAGSYLLVLKYCLKHPNPELKSLAQAMVERLDRYGHDVAPQHPRIADLDRLSQDAKQF